MPITRAPSYGTEAASAAPMPDDAPEIQTTMLIYASTCGTCSGGVSGLNSPAIARAWISSKLAPAA